MPKKSQIINEYIFLASYLITFSEKSALVIINSSGFLSWSE